MRRYTTVLFDLDNTLLDFFKSERVSICKVFAEAGLRTDDATLDLYSKTNAHFWKDFELGKINIEDIYIGRFVEFLRLTDQTADPSWINERYFYYLSDSHYKIEGCDEILEYLYNKGYKIYIVTNGAAKNQHTRIKHSGIYKKICGLFISEEMGFQKPSKEYFYKVFENIEEKDLSKILLIGDSMSSDILGGINAGIDTCWLNNGGSVKKYEPTYTVTSLKEVESIL